MSVSSDKLEVITDPRQVNWSVKVICVPFERMMGLRSALCSMSFLFRT